MLDGSALGRRKTGNETYIRGLIDGFASVGDPGVDVTVVTTPRCPHPRPAHVRWIEIPQGNFLTRNFRRIPRLLSASRPDVYHAIYWVGFGLATPYVLTIHDLSFVTYPAGFRLAERQFYARLIRRAATKARRIITVSEFSKRELCERWSIAPERVTVTYNGLDPAYVPGDGPDPQPYVLYVGNLHPRKNLVRLVEAFALVLRDQDVPLRLVIAGQTAPGSGALFEAVRRSGVGDAVRFTGYVDRDRLVRLYQRAAVTVLPSLYEGFGLPALEAMACGSPVVVSATSALPEVVGDAGVLVDPRSVDDIAAGLSRVLSSDALRAELRDKGLARARLFTWERAARETVAVYRSASEGN